MRNGLPRSAWLSLFGALTGCAESPVASEDLDAAFDPSWSVDARFLLPDAAAAPQEDPTGMPTGMVGEELLDGALPAQPIDDAAAAGDARSPLTPQADAKVPATTMDAAVAKDSAVPMEAAMMPATCTEPQRSCNGRCLDLRSDEQNCGSCGHRCASGESCVESGCRKQPPQSCTWRGFQARAYLFCTQERSWREARASCLNAGLDLTIVASAAENDFVRASGSDTWIGASDSQNEGTWSWVPPGVEGRTNGAALDYKSWGPSEPNNTRGCMGVELGNNCLGDQTDEDCAMVAGDGRWNDTYCEQNRRYVCEAY